MFDTLVTFTRKTTDEIIHAGGSQSWRLNARKAAAAQYLVCARNRNNAENPLTGPEQHGEGFLIGHMRGLESARDGRLKIAIQDWAPISVPGLWRFGRFPVHYARLEDLGIDIGRLKFRKIDANTGDVIGGVRSGCESLQLSIAEAKPALARFYGVQEQAIEIVIRG